MANQSEQGDRLTINLKGLRDEIENYGRGSAEYEELELAGKIRSLIRRGLNKTPFTFDFVRQAVKFALGMKAVERIEEYRNDEAWKQLSIDEKLSRLVDFAVESEPCSVQQVVLKYWDALSAGTDLPARRLGELRRGEGDRLTEDEAEAISQVTGADKEELLRFD